jgi:site-specific recombinase XerD
LALITRIPDCTGIEMHDLIVFDQQPSGALICIADEHEALRDFAANEKAASTRDCYRRDFTAFTTWCNARGLTSLPATPATVAWHISAAAQSGLSVSSIGRRLAGIAYAHKLAQQRNPCATEDVKIVLAGVRRTLGTAPKRKAAATAERVRAMLDACPDTMIGLRDRALLAFGFASAMRRSEIVALQVSDLTECPDGYRVRIVRSKTDQTGEGQEIVIPRGAKIRPVEHVQSWLQAAQITEGPLFRPVRLGGRVCPWGLRGVDVADVVKKYAAKVGLDAKNFAGHSLRSGYVTSCVEANAPLLKMSEQTRHKDLSMLQTYSRRVNAFVDHSGSSFL